MVLKMNHLALFALIVISVGCKKEGCTDPISINYNAEAETDDGSCTYSGSKTFWYRESTSINLINNGATTLTYYVDGVEVGASPTNVSWGANPGCDASIAVSVTKNLGNVKEQVFSYRVVDQTGVEYWNATTTFNAASCEGIELSL